MNNLKRSNSNKVFSGVCGGIGELFNIDPTIIRIIWALFFIRSFSFAFLAYIVCTLIIPMDDGVIYSDVDSNHNDTIRKKTPILVGFALIIWGLFLLSQILFPWFTFQIINVVKYWPVLLIILGFYIIYSQRNSQ